MFKKEANILISLLLIVALFFLCTEFVKDILITEQTVKQAVMNGNDFEDIAVHRIIKINASRTENEFISQRQSDFSQVIIANSSLYTFSWYIVPALLGVLIYIYCFIEEHILFGSRMLLKYIHRADGKMYSSIEKNQSY